MPHGSGNTKQISDLCIAMAEELGLEWRQDVSNNVVIWKKASPGCENSKPIILQGHLDMVCAKEDGCTKDMTREGLDLRTDGEWVWADKTSLGGDNCIAVAMILPFLRTRRWCTRLWKPCSRWMRRSAWTAPLRWTAPT